MRSMNSLSNPAWQPALDIPSSMNDFAITVGLWATMSSRAMCTTL